MWDTYALSHRSGCAVPGASMKDIMDWAGTPEKHLSEVFAETKGDGHPLLEMAKEISMRNAADTFIQQ